MILQILTLLLLLARFNDATPLHKNQLISLPAEMIDSIAEHLDDKSVGALAASSKRLLNIIALRNDDQICSLLDHLCMDRNHCISMDLLQNSAIRDKMKYLYRSVELNHFNATKLIWSLINSKNHIVLALIPICIEKNYFESFKFFLSFLKNIFIERFVLEAIKYEREEMMNEFLIFKNWSILRRLYYAVYTNNVIRLRELYQEFIDSKWALFYLYENFELACERGHTETVHWFINETDILSLDNEENDYVYNGFLKACQCGFVPIVKLLMKDLDPSVEDNFLIVLAAQSRDFEMMSVLLSDSRVDPYDIQSDLSALFVASYKDDWQVVRFFLDKRPLDLSKGELFQKLALLDASLLDYILDRAIISNSKPILDAMALASSNNLYENTEILLNTLLKRFGNCERVRLF